MKVLYDRLKSISDANVRMAILCFDGWIVGSGVDYISGLTDSHSDWDIIIPYRNWGAFSSVFGNSDVLLNNFGGLKIDGNDYWPDDVEQYLCKRSNANFTELKMYNQMRDVLVVSSHGNVEFGGS